MSPDFLSRDLASLMREAAAVRDAAFGDRITFSKKVFIPLTHLCRDTCGYCTFVHPPRRGEAAYLTPEQVLEIARAGQAAGCAEALFTLGDKPELKWKPAAEALAAMGYATTLDYLAAMGALVFKETGLLPHFNPGLMDAADLAKLRKSSVSMGIMLESTAERLGERGGAHYGAPDKVPALRLATLEAAGKAKVPFTSGILIGIGETREERIEALMALRDLHRAHGHLQEVIIQNFKAKPDTRMADAPEPSFDELLWTIAVARLIFGDTLSVQAPPNLQEPGYGRLIEAGIDDWGGVSPVTPDHVNPERPWPSSLLEEDRYRLLARNMTTSSPATAATARYCSSRRPRRRCSACRPKTLVGHGLFDRVHVADRPAYLSALAMRPRAREPHRSSFASGVKRRLVRRSRAVHLGRDALPSARSGRAATMSRASAKSSR